MAKIFEHHSRKYEQWKTNLRNERWQNTMERYRDLHVMRSK